MKWCKLTILEALSITELLIDCANGDYVEEDAMYNAVSLLRTSIAVAEDEDIPDGNSSPIHYEGD